MAKTTRQSKNEETSEEPFFSRGVLIAIAVILALLFVFGMLPTIGNQGDDNEQANTTTRDSEQQPADSDQGRAENDESESQDAADQTNAGDRAGQAFSYVAAEGDSLTSLARQAVMSFDASLTPLERVAAETKLAQDHGGVMLNVGQAFEFDRSAVQNAVSWAKNLPAEAKTAWQPYADAVIWGAQQNTAGK